METGKIPLSEMIESLRSELLEAVAAGETSPLKFEIEDVELELKVVVRREAEGRAGIKFWVVDAGGKGKIGDESVQTFRLKLKPRPASGQVLEVAEQKYGKDE